jgi:antitoxin VapB
MNLQIRHPRARALATELAQRQNVTMTDAVIHALEADLDRVKHSVPLIELANKHTERLRALSKPGGRDWTKEERDDMWGHV